MYKGQHDTRQFCLDVWVASVVVFLIGVLYMYVFKLCSTW